MGSSSYEDYISIKEFPEETAFMRAVFSGKGEGCTFNGSLLITALEDFYTTYSEKDPEIESVSAFCVKPNKFKPLLRAFFEHEKLSPDLIVYLINRLGFESIDHLSDPVLNAYQRAGELMVTNPKKNIKISFDFNAPNKIGVSLLTEFREVMGDEKNTNEKTRVKVDGLDRIYTQKIELDTVTRFQVDLSNPEDKYVLVNYSAKASGEDAKHAKAVIDSIALHTAVMNGNKDAITRLLDKGADFNAQDSAGKIALLSKTEIRVNMRDHNNKTPLHYAAENDDAEVIKALLVKGADVNALDNAGKTALHYAVAREAPDEKMILALVDAPGANVCVKDQDGKMAVDYRKDKDSNVYRYLYALTCVESYLTHQYNKKEPTKLDNEKRTILEGMRKELLPVKDEKGQKTEIGARMGKFSEKVDADNSLQQSNHSALATWFGRLFVTLAKVLKIEISKEPSQDKISPKGGQSHGEAFYKNLNPVVSFFRPAQAPASLGNGKENENKNMLTAN